MVPRETQSPRRAFTSSGLSSCEHRNVVSNWGATPASAAGPPLSPAHAAAAATPPENKPDTLPAQQLTRPNTGLWHVSRVPLNRPNVSRSNSLPTWSIAPIATRASLNSFAASSSNSLQLPLLQYIEPPQTYSFPSVAVDFGIGHLNFRHMTSQGHFGPLSNHVS